MPKRKPYDRPTSIGLGRHSGTPPKGWERAAKPGWLVGFRTFHSLAGRVVWNEKYAKWGAFLRTCHSPPWGEDCRLGFDNPRQAMMWVEEHSKLRARRMKWCSVQT